MNNFLQLINTDAGKHLLGLPKEGKVFKVTPESIHWTYGQDSDGKWLCQSHIQCVGTNTYAQILLPILTKMDIANKDSYKAFLHYSELERYNYPLIFLDVDDITPSSGASNAEGLLTSNNNTWQSWADAYNSSVSTALLTNPTGETTYQRQNSTSTHIFHHRYWKTDYTSISSSATLTQVDWRHKSRYGSDNSDGRESGVITLGTQSATLVGTDWRGVSTEYQRDSSGAISGYNGSAFRLATFNATGLAAITPGTSIIKYCSLHEDDLDNAENADNVGALTYLPSATTEADRPMMRVTYKLPTGFFAIL